MHGRVVKSPKDSPETARRRKEKAYEAQLTENRQQMDKAKVRLPFSLGSNRY